MHQAKSSRHALAVAALTLASAVAPAQAQVIPIIQDWRHVAAACTPADLDSLRHGRVVPQDGSLRTPLVAEFAGPLRYICNVHDSFNGTSPPLRWLRLLYVDPTGGGVRATLHRKSKYDGFTAHIATVTSTAGSGLQEAVTEVPALDFNLYGYYVVLQLNPQATQSHAHLVKLIQ